MPLAKPKYNAHPDEQGIAPTTVPAVKPDEGLKVENVIASSRGIEDYIKEKPTDVIAKDVLHFYNQQFCVKFRFENC